MSTIHGYQIREKLFESSRTSVYRADTNPDGRSVILKILKEAHISPEQLAKYRQEYEIVRSLDHEGVIKAYSYEIFQRTPVIVFEDYRGQRLDQRLQVAPLAMADFLPMASRITEILGVVHAANIIHKDLNPANILFNPETKQVKIIDFGIATVLPKEAPDLQNPTQLEGTLPYVSPEQTGRMNRALDYRTDFYSLGVTFYELLTGQLPFPSGDPLELVHAHIALRPIAPHRLNPEIPAAVSNLIMKLLEKNAEDRYQSAWGIKADLDQCWEAWSHNQAIALFPLGQNDLSDRFQLPQKLYGREQELSRLLEAFERVAQAGLQAVVRPLFMLIAGYSGIGKSALVREVYKPITEQRGHFVSGKFDQLQRNVPYSAIIQAFRSLFGQLLASSEGELQYWRQELSAALGNNGQVIVEVLPELELLLGPQPAIPELPPTENQNRFILVFQNFVRVFAAPDHPLVLFLDDLQWADGGSLRLIQALMTTTGNNALLLIGAYRDNEVSASHSLMHTLEDLRKQRCAIEQIELKPLHPEHVIQWIADTVHRSPQEARPLAELVRAKTGGNPFFMGEFLKALYSEGLLSFDYGQRGWMWNLRQIQNANFTDNVVELMAGKIQSLPAPTKQALHVAACIGNQFRLRTLALVQGEGTPELRERQRSVAAALHAAIAQGYVIPLSNLYQAAESEAMLDDRLEPALNVAYRFTHDRIQQAAYSLLPEGDRQQLHLRIGRLLLADSGDRISDEAVFEIVDQLNEGIALLDNPTERLRLAELNLQAGRKARSATAYDSAQSYLSLGLSLLPADAWSAHYDLTLALHTEAMQAAYLSTHFAEAERLAEATLAHTHTTLDQAYIYEIKTLFYIAQNQMQTALDTGLQALEMLNVPFTSVPPEYEDIDNLANLPAMESPEYLAALRILVVLHAPAYIANPMELPRLNFTSVSLCIHHGNSVLAPFAYAYYGMLLCGIFGEMDKGYRYGQLATRLIDILDAREIQCKVEVLVNACIRHWHEPLNQSTQLLRRAVTLGLETGDLEYAATAVTTWCANVFLVGEPLESAETMQEGYWPLVHKLKQGFYLNYFRIWTQVVRNLRSLSPQPEELDGELFEAETLLPFLVETNNYTSLFAVYLAKTILHYLFGQYPQAIADAEQAIQYQQSAAGLIIFTQVPFYHALALLAEYPWSDRPTQEASWEKITGYLQQLQTWAVTAPMTFQHKCDLLAAEMAQIQGNVLAAMDLYEAAIRGAREHGYLHEEAIAYERAAEFYQRRQLEEVSQTHLIKAYEVYRIWGAIAKCKHLEDSHPAIFLAKSTTHQRSKHQSTWRTTSRTTTSGGSGLALDLATVLKAAQAISSEIILDKLLAKLMGTLLENAGAQRGYLILETKGKLFIEASGSVETSAIEVLQAIPLDVLAHQIDQATLCVAIVNYVARTRESVVLNNAIEDERFRIDAYIRQNQPKSILCAPLLNQGKLTGIVYLENNLSVGAFTPDRLEMLNLLSAQAAISISNARYYASLADLNRAYERFVPRQFLQLLDKDSITEVALGDHVEQEMSVLFADIRDFTALSESMTPEDNFRFINAFLSRMETAITDNQGFIDKYIGDAIMALFSEEADHAVRAGIDMQKALQVYNQQRQRSGYMPITIGIGINTGQLMLGTVGGQNRMDSTVISDAVNLASRIEGLTKRYQVSLLISQETFFRLNQPDSYAFRVVDRVNVQGKLNAVTVYEFFDGDLPEVRDAKLATKSRFEEGFLLYRNQRYREAQQCFEDCLRHSSLDKVAQIYLERCRLQSL